jgi:carbon dioxide concentrating mechanism protein CcmN
MTLLSLPMLASAEIYVIGDVIIHASAVIAAGSILQAIGENQVIIEEGACIGMGSVITASQGQIVIGKGVILGAGVLIVGAGKIGNHACIGSGSTLWNASVEAMAVVSPGSLLGDLSRSPTSELPKANAKTNGKVPASAIDPQILTSEASDPWQDPPSEPVPNAGSDPPLVRTKSPVVGQVYINEMLYALFPGRKPPS